jgi:hypothetical protein
MRTIRASRRTALPGVETRSPFESIRAISLPPRLGVCAQKQADASEGGDGGNAERLERPACWRFPLELRA